MPHGCGSVRVSGRGTVPGVPGVTSSSAVPGVRLGGLPWTGSMWQRPGLDRVVVTVTRSRPGRCGTGTVPGPAAGPRSGTRRAAGTGETAGPPGGRRPGRRAARPGGGAGSREPALTPQEPHPCHIHVVRATSMPHPCRWLGRPRGRLADVRADVRDGWDGRDGWGVQGSGCGLSGPAVLPRAARHPARETISSP